MKITETVFGTIDSTADHGKSEVQEFTLYNGSGMVVKIISYGAAVTTICVKDRSGNLKDVVLGYDDLEGYLRETNPYFGATVGRVANRIREGKFTIHKQNFQLSANNGVNHLHGGFNGFDKKTWQHRIEDNKLIFSYLSKDGEEGYPGDLLAEVSYFVTEDNALQIRYQATTTKPTPVCLTNHSYFNLAGDEFGSEELIDHIIEVNANSFTPVDDSMVPTGVVESVDNTAYDLRKPSNLFQLLKKFPSGPNGFDINFCVNKAETGLSFVSR